MTLGLVFRLLCARTAVEDAATPGGLGGRGTGPRVSRAALKVRAHVFRGARVPAQRSTDVLPDALVALQWSDWRVLLVTGSFPHFRFLQTVLYWGLWGWAWRCLFPLRNTLPPRSPPSLPCSETQGGGPAALAFCC